MLRDQRGGRRLPGDGDPRVLPGRYDFRELLAAYRSLVLPAIPTIDGVTTSDIDEVHHRIVIGVGDESLIGRARQKIANLGLSNDLVEIEHVPPPELDADLNDFVRPVLGALKVSVMGDCTLGFNLIRYVGSAGDTAATARYFVTNSHCTTNRNSVDGNTAFQGGSFIATEIGDPAAFNHSGNPLCPSGYICRWADVALFEYDDPSDADQGQVAFPTLNTTTFSNSVTITAVQGPMAGYGINMIGRVSGRRSATVLATCVDVWGITDWPSGRLLCQGRSNYVRASGDSGAPVITAFGDGTAWATGVHWGGNSTNSYFSSMDIVLNELFYGVPGWPNLSPVVYP